MRFSVREIIFGICHPWILFNTDLDLSRLDPDPIKEFERWYAAMQRCFWVQFPNAACLSTLDLKGFPDGRMVLLKSTDSRGFVFFTNFNSSKGRSLTITPKASLTFYWETLQRQVRAKGSVERISEIESDAYFASRPRESQIGAWASLQSDPLESRAVLLGRMQEFRDKFKDSSVPRPPHWGGFRIVPERVEFMILRASRLHERVAYTKETDGHWSICRLYP